MARMTKSGTQGLQHLGESALRFGGTLLRVGEHRRDREAREKRWGELTDLQKQRLKLEEAKDERAGELHGKQMTAADLAREEKEIALEKQRDQEVADENMRNLLVNIAPHLPPGYVDIRDDKVYSSEAKLEELYFDVLNPKGSKFNPTIYNNVMQVKSSLLAERVKAGQASQDQLDTFNKQWTAERAMFEAKPREAEPVEKVMIGGKPTFAKRSEAPGKEAYVAPQTDYRPAAVKIHEYRQGLSKEGKKAFDEFMKLYSTRARSEPQAIDMYVKLARIYDSVIADIGTIDKSTLPFEKWLKSDMAKRVIAGYEAEMQETVVPEAAPSVGGAPSPGVVKEGETISLGSPFKKDKAEGYESDILESSKRLLQRKNMLPDRGRVRGAKAVLFD